MSDDRLSANREKIKQRNLKLHEQGRTIEDCDPREMHAQNLDPEEIRALNLQHAIHERGPEIPWGEPRPAPDPERHAQRRDDSRRSEPVGVQSPVGPCHLRQAGLIEPVVAGADSLRHHQSERCHG